jgi:branched-chain amino acid aminotransferase
MSRYDFTGKPMIQTWRITTTQNIELQISAASLDEVTRQLPDGYYSTFRTFDRCTRVLGFDSHLQRLYEPVYAPEVDESFLRRQLRALLEPYRPNEARVRAVMTRDGQSFIAIEPLKPLPPEVYEKGVRLETTQLERQHPRLKSTTFIGRSDAERKHVAAQGIFEALLVKAGSILEGMTSNFFYVHQFGTLPYLGTARDDVLLGITRQTVIDVAQELGLEIRYEPLKQDQMASINEAFITSSSRGIVPVIQIDAVRISQGSPGPITRQLMSAYEAYATEHAESI